MSSQLHAFSPLSEWHMTAFRAVGTVRYAGPPQVLYARVDVPDPMAAIDLHVVSVSSRLRICRPLVTSRAAARLGAIMQAVTDVSPAVSVI